MKTVKYAKYVGTMIGPDGYLHQMDLHRGKIHSKNQEYQRNFQEPR